jgi:Fe2+ or Zn2+ uptake regulation protein
MRHHSRQREQLLDLLRVSEDHPTAALLARRFGSLHGPVSLSTLYRNLDILVAGGSIRRIRVDDGPDRFDANLRPHYHVTCTRCDRLWDVPVRKGDRCRFSLPTGFRPETWEITVRGTCAGCARDAHPFSEQEV